MKYLKQFNIPITGLEIGIHQYEFDIDDKFFEEYEESEIHKCKIHLVLDLIRQTDMIILQFQLNGSVELICDRCLDPFDFPIDCTESVLLKFKNHGTQEPDEDEEVIFPEQQEINIRQYIYDFISLQVPFRKVHPEDENGESKCDKEVLRKIQELSVKKSTDPRWDRLKDIENN